MSSISDRLKEERVRLGLSQTALAEIGEVVRKAQQNYESGLRTPNGDYFAKVAQVGVDVSYVITGIRSSTPEPLKPDEAELLDDYRQASPEAKRALRASGAALANPAGKVRRSGKKVA